MNTDTGRVYELLSQAEVGDQLTPEQLLKEQGEHQADALAAMEAMERGEKIVAVSEDVAHQLRVGQRELERRRERRRQRGGGVAGS